MAIISTVQRTIEDKTIEAQVKLCGDGNYIVRVRVAGQCTWYKPLSYITDNKSDAYNSRDIIMRHYAKQC